MTWLMIDHGNDGDHGDHVDDDDDDGGVEDHLNDHPPSSRSTRPTTTFGVIFVIKT